MSRNWIEIMLLLLAFSLGSSEIVKDSSVIIDGQVRTRTMFNKTSTAAGADNLLGTGLRSRLGVTANPSEQVQIKVEVQDSRNFGSEPLGVSNDNAHHTAVIGNAGNLDLHQAFFNFQIGPVGIKGGRQKIKLGSQRFISSLEWHPNARVFDGVTANYEMSGGDAKLTGLLFKVRDTSASVNDDYLTLGGFHYQRKLFEAVNMETYAFYDQSGSQLGNYDYVHVGARVNGNTEMIYYDQEFIWQAGSNGGIDKKAFYNATRAGIIIKSKYKIGMGFDMMSGDDSADKEKTYVANYFFAHAYFGWMDYFGVNPDLGIMNIRLDGLFPLNSQLTLKPQFHYFLQAAGSNDPYGMEFDMELHGDFFPNSKIVLGGGLFVPDKGAMQLSSAENSDEEIAFQIYLMPVFNF